MSYSGYGSGRYSSPAYASYSGNSRRSGSLYSTWLAPSSSSSFTRRTVGGSYGLLTSKSNPYLPTNSGCPRDSISSRTKSLDTTSRNPKNYDPSVHASNTIYKTVGLEKRSPEFSGHKLNISKSASSITSDLSDSSFSSGTSERSRNRLASSGSQDLSSETSSRYGSLSCSRSSVNDENEKDYKKLYEELKIENDRLQEFEKENGQLKENLRKTEEELEKAKKQLKKVLETNNAKNAVTDAEKKERRALERKLSEMEEEVKNISKLKTENEKLKAENRALSRVVCKLSK